MRLKDTSMKLLLSFILTMLSICSIAQQSDTTNSSINKKLSIGAQYSTVTYMLKSSKVRESGGLTPRVFINGSYNLNKRTILQIGLGYSSIDFDARSIYYKSADSVIYNTDYRRTRGFAVPVTGRYTPFNPGKRLQLYATISVVPAFGIIENYIASEMNGIKTIQQDSETSVFNVFATAGLMLNFKINNRFDSFLEGNLLYKNIGMHSNYADSKPKSVGIGINYKLKP